MLDLGFVGEPSMAAGPVGMIGGVFGGSVLPLMGSDLFEDNTDEADDVTGFKLSCLCGKALLSEPLLVRDSQLSFRVVPMPGVADVVDIELMKDRRGLGCISCFARISGPNDLGSLYGSVAAMTPRSAFGPFGGWNGTS